MCRKHIIHLSTYNQIAHCKCAQFTCCSQFSVEICHNTMQNTVKARKNMYWKLHKCKLLSWRWLLLFTEEVKIHLNTKWRRLYNVHQGVSGLELKRLGLVWMHTIPGVAQIMLFSDTVHKFAHNVDSTLKKLVRQVANRLGAMWEKISGSKNINYLNTHLFVFQASFWPKMFLKLMTAF